MNIPVNHEPRDGDFAKYIEQLTSGAAARHEDAHRDEPPLKTPSPTAASATPTRIKGLPRRDPVLGPGPTTPTTAPTPTVPPALPAILRKISIALWALVLVLAATVVVMLMRGWTKGVAPLSMGIVLLVIFARLVRRALRKL